MLYYKFSANAEVDFICHCNCVIVIGHSLGDVSKYLMIDYQKLWTGYSIILNIVIDLFDNIERTFPIAFNIPQMKEYFDRSSLK